MATGKPTDVSSGVDNSTRSTHSIHNTYVCFYISVYDEMKSENEIMLVPVAIFREKWEYLENIVKINSHNNSSCMHLLLTSSKMMNDYEIKCIRM